MNEATSRQASKQTQSVHAGEATSRQASKHSRCKHNLDDAASPAPQEWETNESASWYKLSTTSFFYLQFIFFANLCFHCCEISLNARTGLQASCICMQQAAAMAHDIYVEGIIWWTGMPTTKELVSREWRAYINVMMQSSSIHLISLQTWVVVVYDEGRNQC